MAVTQAQHLHILPLVLLMDLQDPHRIILQVQYAAVKVPWLADLKKQTNKLTASNHIVPLKQKIHILVYVNGFVSVELQLLVYHSLLSSR